MRKPKESEAYQAGFNKGFTGVANTTNCSFQHFGTAENTHEWERGVKDGEAKRNRDARAASKGEKK